MQRIPNPDDLPYPPSEEGRAKGEVDAIRRRLDISRMESEHRREELARELVSWSMLALASIVAIAVAGSIIVLAIHYLGPEKWLWLSEGKLTAIQTFVFSSVVAGGATSYFQTHSSIQLPQDPSL